MSKITEKQWYAEKPESSNGFVYIKAVGSGYDEEVCTVYGADTNPDIVPAIVSAMPALRLLQRVDECLLVVEKTSDTRCALYQECKDIRQELAKLLKESQTCDIKITQDIDRDLPSISINNN